MSSKYIEYAKKIWRNLGNKNINTCDIDEETMDEIALKIANEIDLANKIQ